MMKRIVAPCLAALAVGGCAVCAMDAAPQKHRMAMSVRQSPPSVQAPARSAALKSERIAPADVLNAVVVDQQGRSVARVENYRLRADGDIDLLTVVHGADGSGVQTVMLPYTQFKMIGKADDHLVLQTALTLKPHPEFAQTQ